MNIRIRHVVMMMIDAVLVNLSFYIMLLLRFEGQVPFVHLHTFFYLIPLLTITSLLFLVKLKLYNRVWEYASIDELQAIVKVSTLTISVMVALGHFIHYFTLPRSIYIGAWILMTCLIGASRVSWRLIRGSLIPRVDSDARRVLVVGGGHAGAMLVKEISTNPQLKLQVVSIVDDDPAKHQLILCGVPIHGGRQHISGLVRDLAVDEIIIAMPSVSGDAIRDIVALCKKTPARLRILPGVYQSARSSLMQGLREVQMEDLLHRKPVKVNLAAVSGYLAGKVVLVTGAGGSIGSELCRQIAGFNPAKLVILDYGESNLFDIEQELRTQKNLTVWAELVDVKCEEKMEEVFRAHRPAVVFHAAAFKHVPMMQRHPDEALRNNVLGTRNTAVMADEYGAEIFILISTDKAVNPTNIMGASKRLAELVVKDLNRSSKTRFASVRFGNVLGSRGSVIPTFMKQIQKGGPVTVTHPEMKRYFMTIPEAVQLVIQAGAMTMGGEVFVLDMGDPVKIDDLARDLIQLAGYEPDRDIAVVYSGIRPGEKLFEELFTNREEIGSTLHERIFISKKDLDKDYMDMASTVLELKHRSMKNRDEVITLIHTLLPEFKPAMAGPIGDTGQALHEPNAAKSGRRQAPQPLPVAN